MKRTAMVSLIISLYFLLTPFVSYADIKVNVNGSALELAIAPQIEKGRALVPLRTIFEALGALVAWDDSTKTVKASLGSRWMVLKVGESSALVNDKMIILDPVSRIYDGKTLVPLRIVSESLGAKVTWDEERQTVYIDSKGADAMEKKLSELTAEEIAYMYTLISYFATVDSPNMEFTHAMFPSEETNNADTLLKYELEVMRVYSECPPPVPPTDRFMVIYNELKSSREFANKLHTLVLESKEAGNAEALLFFPLKVKSTSRQRLEALWEQTLVMTDKASQGLFDLMQNHGYNFFPQ